MLIKIDTQRSASRQVGRRVVVVGAGVGGLTAALLLSAAGFAVTVLEKEEQAGGKLHRVPVAGHGIESGPTVLTMRWVFEAIFASVGACLEDHLRLTRAKILARHSWEDGAVLDLHADADVTADAIAALSGPAEAEGYRAFCRRTEEVFRTLDAAFIEHPAPSMAGLTRSVGLLGLGALTRIRPFTSLSNVVDGYFRDPRLRQLFGRYATYCGSSPFSAPGPLMLIAHVEQLGVWLVEGGMTRIAEALERLAIEHGATIRYGAAVSTIDVRDGRASGVQLASGERIEADAVVFNGDPAALFSGLLGPETRRAVPAWGRGDRSLSALTWSVRGEAKGFPLSHHTVFFSKDYPAEFQDILTRNRLPEDPTIYVCAQDRDASGGAAPTGPESLFLLVNAPATADAQPLSTAEIASCETRVMERLDRAGLHDYGLPRGTDHDRAGRVLGNVSGFGGRALRPGVPWLGFFVPAPVRGTRIRGLYVAGGGVHPGPGVPMAALSGRHAASAVTDYLASTATSRTMAMPGGISTRSAATGGTP